MTPIMFHKTQSWKDKWPSNTEALPTLHSHFFTLVIKKMQWNFNLKPYLPVHLVFCRKRDLNPSNKQQCDCRIERLLCNHMVDMLEWHQTEVPLTLCTHYTCFPIEIHFHILVCPVPCCCLLAACLFVEVMLPNPFLIMSATLTCFKIFLSHLK